MPLWLWLIVDALCVYRLARLITLDTITQPLRAAVLNRWAGRQQHISYLALCPWCISVWLGFAAYALTRYAPTVWIWVAVPLALSAVAGYLSERA